MRSAECRMREGRSAECGMRQVGGGLENGKGKGENGQRLAATAHPILQSPFSNPQSPISSLQSLVIARTGWIGRDDETDRLLGKLGGFP